MAYKRIISMEILDIIRRYFDSQTISQISSVSGIDRKTVRKYIKEIHNRGINFYDKEKILLILPEIIPRISGRPTGAQSILEPYKQEISNLITSADNKIKPKTAFEVINEKHGLQGKVSYSSFKRFVRENKFVLHNDKTTCRLDYQAGEQIQIDYAKMGMLYDPILKRNRAVYGFIGTLSYSRYKFVEFVFSQDQQSFVQSHVRMFNFFGGVPKVIYLDNLKTGVIKPDLYNPIINKAYAELAEYYECFLNPCRVATPKDKPIVERDVQTIREQFRKYKALDKSITIAEANKTMLLWLTDTYGKRVHGTTGQKPYEEFINTERATLLPLAIEPFQAAYWKEAMVHPDHYIQVNKKSYSIPHQYVGKKLWVKVTHNIVSVFFEDKLIKEHTIPSGYRQTDLNDFPENMQSAMDKGLPYALRKNAEAICPEFGELINKILSPHAYINMRKAQGILYIADKYPKDIVASASRAALDNYRYLSPKIFKAIIQKLINNKEDELPGISDETSTFIRQMDYFIYKN
ncbi:MAG TPA: IS21 family transposase [Ignavibacteriaceae bacterium]|nr:IS21 family transposase [Ignavibacteriaceae bacterium]